MAKSFKVADFFARIGVKADRKELNLFISRLKVLDKSLKSVKANSRAAIKFRTDTRGIGRARANVDQLNKSLQKVKRNSRINITTTHSDSGMPSGGGRGGVGVLGGFGAGAGAAGLSKFSKGFMPGLGAAFAIKNLVQTEQNITAIENALISATGSVKGSQDEMQFLRETSKELGTNFLASANNYKNLVAAGKDVGFSLEDTRELFLGVSESASVLGLSNDDLTGTMRAVVQMLSKGTIQSEELKGQLGERLVGAVGKFARSMDVSTEELFRMLQAGKVLAKEVLPGFAKILREDARAGDALARSIEKNLSNMNRMFNAFTDMKLAFARGGFQEIMTDLFIGTAKAISFLTPAAKKLGQVMRTVAIPFIAVAKVVSEFPLLASAFALAVGIYMLGPMMSLMMLSVGITAVFGTMWAVIVAPITVFLTALTTMALLIDDVMVGLAGGKSVMMELAGSSSPLRYVGQLFIGLGYAIQQAYEWVTKLWDKIANRPQASSVIGKLVPGIDEGAPNPMAEAARRKALSDSKNGAPSNDTINQTINVQVDAPGGDPDVITGAIDTAIRNANQARPRGGRGGRGR